MTIPASNAERETILNLNADDRSTWVVFSDDPVMQAKLERIGATLTENRDGSKFYTLPFNQVSFRNPSKPMSAERKAALGQALREYAARQPSAK